MTRTKKSSVSSRRPPTRKSPARKTARKATHGRRVGGRKYGEKASKKVGKAIREMKRGTLRSGRSGKKVRSRKQAIAIGLSQARRAGGKVPEPPGDEKPSS